MSPEEELEHLRSVIVQEQSSVQELTKRTTELRSALWDLRRGIQSVADELSHAFPALAKRLEAVLNE